VRDRTDAQNAFQEALEDGQIGIIILTERVADLIRPTVNRYLFTEHFPLILEVPDRLGPVEDRLGIRELVNAAIGIQL
jgi:V/A-type H+-transporting ATPase subunit F